MRPCSLPAEEVRWSTGRDLNDQDGLKGTRKWDFQLHAELAQHIPREAHFPGTVFAKTYGAASCPGNAMHAMQSIIVSVSGKSVSHCFWSVGVQMPLRILKYIY